jgi:outer membrane protein assembly factor BamB
MIKLSRALLGIGMMGACGITSALAYQVLTNHNNAARTGKVSRETVLTPANVSGLQELFQSPVDGQVYAQPLCLTNQLVYKNGISAGKQSIVIVATEHGSVYAFDAKTGENYWRISLLDQGWSPVQASDPKLNGCTDLVPEIGITATPVIDPAAGPNGRIFAVVMETDGQGKYNYKLHALDLATGKDALTPAIISGSVSGKGPATTFVAIKERSRAALLLSNGVIYIAFGAFCDPDVLPYAGFVMGYQETNLSQVAIFSDNPNGSPTSPYLPDGSGSGIWQAGLGVAADGNGNIYVTTGNGPFDQTLKGGFPANRDYGDTVLKLSTNNGLNVVDYFTPYNQQQEADSDTDLASGGAVILPAIVDSHGKAHHLLVIAGKDTNVYLLNSNYLGKFNAAGNKIYQEVDGVNPRGAWSSPAYFNGSIYISGIYTTLKRFQFDFSNPDKPLLNTTPAAQTAQEYGFPSITPSISANGTKNGIVWGYEYDQYHTILHAFDATTLTELYNSGSLLGGTGVKFAVPTICNGRVYVGTSNSLVAFGL